MLISLNWLREYVDLPETVEELCERLTLLGLEIEKITRPGEGIDKVIIGQVLSVEPHPNADKLSVCRTDVGAGEPLQIVCGATNMKPGDKVPTALVGATLPGGFEIGRRKMRGVESAGMMCSARELGLGEDHMGLLILPEDAPIGQDIRTYLGLDDTILEIEVTPNRGDWASMIGVARELAAWFGREFRVPRAVPGEGSQPVQALTSVTIEDPEGCPRYIARVIEGVKVGPSPDWMARRLTAAGMRPINNVVDVTNYVLMETGHPLHAFDYDRLAENRIVVRRARSGEQITTLDGERRNLTPDMLVIADARCPQAVAGIMGGADSEVTENSTRILLESAVFQPSLIRRTAKNLGLVTEAAQHFQQGADWNMAEYAINRAADLILQLAGGTLAAGLWDAAPNPPAPVSVRLRHDRVASFLGVEMPVDAQRKTLELLGFTPEAQDDCSTTFRVPSWRVHDVSMETDLLEELARFYGYDRLPETLPPVRANAMVFAPYDEPQEKVRRFLADRGLTEVFNWTFSSPALVERAGLPESFAQLVRLSNPLTENHVGMRTSLIPGLLSVAERNARRGAPGLAVFELGPVFHLPAGGEVTPDTLPDEPPALAVLLGGSTPQHWNIPARNYDLYDLKGIVESLAAWLRVDLRFRPVENPWPLFVPGQAAELLLRDQVVGRAGQVSGRVIRAFDLPFDCCVAELDLRAIFDVPSDLPQFQELPAFPPSTRDLAVLVDRSLPAGDLLEAVREKGGAILRDAKIFDVYTGKQVAPDRKSVAISLVFQSPERTLTDADTQQAFDRIVKHLERKFQATLR